MMAICLEKRQSTESVVANRPQRHRILSAIIGAELMLGLNAMSIAAPSGDYSAKIESLMESPTFKAQMASVASDFIRTPSARIATLCRAKFPAGIELDTCILAPPMHIEGKGLPGMHIARWMHEVACEKDTIFSKAALSDKSVTEILSNYRCDRRELERAQAVAAGEAPQNCTEFSWLSFTPNVDRTWATLPAPKVVTKVIAGELIHFEGNRYTIRQTREQAEIEQLQRNTASAAAMLDALGKRNVVQQKFAIVEVSRTTKIFSPDAIQLNGTMTAVGAYRSNRTLTLTNGAKVPAPVIQAICIQGV